MSQFVKCSTNFSLREALGDPLKIQNWNVNSLPTDKQSIENAVIMTESERWPLIIDP